MLNRGVLGALIGAVLVSGVAGQAPATVDFRRDVQPILREHCIGCHGPSQQLSNFRLDRRSDAMRGGNISDIAPGNSAGSRFYLKLIGNRFGAQMPPAGALPPESIAILKAWVDQGAIWPDDVSGEVPPPTPDARATRLLDALRLGDRPAFERVLKASPAAAALTGAGGGMPLMYAAFYGDARTVQQLLDSGADPNAANAAGATALMWAATDLEKTRVLLDYGADVNARSNDGRTPLVIAAGQFTGPAVVKLLLDYGASPAPRLPTDLTPLREAARVGDAEIFRALLDHGADPKGPNAPPVAFLRANCAKCAELVDAGAPTAAAPGPPPVAAPAAAAAAPYRADAAAANPSARVPVSAATIRVAVERSLPLLQKQGISFLEKTGCVSCHHNSLVAMAVTTARENGYKVDEALAARQLKIVSTYVESWRERSLQGIGIAGGQDSVSYIMLGLDADSFPPNAATDAQAYYLKMRQAPDGRWRIAARRPPMESNDIQVTATSMRILQVYGPKAMGAEYAKAVERARDWLVTARPDSTEERAFRLLGLRWAGSQKDVVDAAARDLIAEQRPDGGWAQLASMASDAYATGEALVALRRTGALQPSDPVYQRGVAYLLNTQVEDGSWHVKTRANPVQPIFDSGFPHGGDQWISAAATGWSTIALALAGK